MFLVTLLAVAVLLTFGILLAGLRAASGADDRLGLDLEPALRPVTLEPGRPAVPEPSPVQA